MKNKNIKNDKKVIIVIGLDCGEIMQIAVYDIKYKKLADMCAYRWRKQDLDVEIFSEEIR